MRRKWSRRVSFSPHCYEKQTVSLNSNCNATPRNEKPAAGGFTCQLNAISPVKFLRRVGTSMVRALCLISRRKPAVRGSPSTLTPRRYSVSGDHYRTEAIEDCIEFINSYRKSI